MLDVVAELVTDHVRPRESSQPGLPRERVEETEVKVDRAVSAAKERTDVRARWGDLPAVAAGS